MRHYLFHPGLGFHFWPHLLWAGLTGLFWLGLLGLLIWGALRLLRSRPMAAYTPQWRPYGPQGTAQPGQSAYEILRERYARGEIDTVTFQQMMERLYASAPQGKQPPQEPPQEGTAL
jgi:uncharacterized membrane protein